MKTADFIREHHACPSGAKWALSISKNMSAVWDALVDQGKYDMLIDYATTHTDRDIKDEVADVYAIVRDVVDGKSVDASAAETFFSRMTSIGINRVVYQKIRIAHGPRIYPH